MFFINVVTIEKTLEKLWVLWYAMQRWLKMHLEHRIKTWEDVLLLERRDLSA